MTKKKQTENKKDLKLIAQPNVKVFDTRATTGALTYAVKPNVTALVYSRRLYQHRLFCLTVLKTSCERKNSISASWASFRETPSLSCSWLRFCGAPHDTRRAEEQQRTQERQQTLS